MSYYTVPTSQTTGVLRTADTEGGRGGQRKLAPRDVSQEDGDSPVVLELLSTGVRMSDHQVTHIVSVHVNNGKGRSEPEVVIIHHWIVDRLVVTWRIPPGSTELYLLDPQ